MSQTIDLFNDEKPPQKISIFNDEINLAIWAKKGFFPQKPNPLTAQVSAPAPAPTQGASTPEIKLDSTIDKVEKVNVNTLTPEKQEHSLGKKKKR